MKITYERLIELFSYDPDTGTFRYRKTGNIAGYVMKDGRRRLFVGHGRTVIASRMAWFYVHATEPPLILDHINGNPGDNRIANLRGVNPSQSQCNRGKPSHNKSGFKGVRSGENGRWLASIRKNGKSIHLGTFTDIGTAAQAYRIAASQLHGEFMRHEP